MGSRCCNGADRPGSEPIRASLHHLTETSKIGETWTRSNRTTSRPALPLTSTSCRDPADPPRQPLGASGRVAGGGLPPDAQRPVVAPRGQEAAVDGDAADLRLHAPAAGEQARARGPTADAIAAEPMTVSGTIRARVLREQAADLVEGSQVIPATANCCTRRVYLLHQQRRACACAKPPNAMDRADNAASHAANIMSATPSRGCTRLASRHRQQVGASFGLPKACTFKCVCLPPNAQVHPKASGTLANHNM